ncbi:MAG: response regulator [Chloroflexi bacterium]|nr:response regulator [Chloroflexota bacterium]
MSLSLLIVDDHAEFRKAVAWLLEQKKLLARLYEAADGETGLRMTRSLCPDLVLVDAALPEMSGLEVARRLKEQDADLVVIILLPEDSVPYRRAARESGADAWVVKQRLDEELIITLRNCSTLLDK